MTMGKKSVDNGDNQMEFAGVTVHSIPEMFTFLI